MDALNDSITWILARRAVPVCVLHTAVGVAIHLLPLERSGLSILHPTFEFLRKKEGRAAPLWRSVRRELNDLQDLMGLVRWDMGATVPPRTRRHSEIAS